MLLINRFAKEQMQYSKLVSSDSNIQMHSRLDEAFSQEADDRPLSARGPRLRPALEDSPGEGPRPPDSYDLLQQQTTTARNKLINSTQLLRLAEVNKLILILPAIKPVHHRNPNCVSLGRNRNQEQFTYVNTNRQLLSFKDIIIYF